MKTYMIKLHKEKVAKRKEIVYGILFILAIFLGAGIAGNAG